MAVSLAVALVRAPPSRAEREPPRQPTLADRRVECIYHGDGLWLRTYGIGRVGSGSRPA
jgi:hypothetical protein